MREHLPSCLAALKCSCTCAEGVTVGQTCTLYYDRSKGTLPSTSKLVFKAGLNRWETIQLVDMARAEGFKQGAGSEWWSVDITLPQVRLTPVVGS